MEGDRELRRRSTETGLRTPAADSIRRPARVSGMQPLVRADFHTAVAARHGLERHRHPFFILSYLLDVFTDAPSPDSFAKILNIHNLSVYVSNWFRSYDAGPAALSPGRRNTERLVLLLRAPLRMYERVAAFLRTLPGPRRAVTHLRTERASSVETYGERLIYADTRTHATDRLEAAAPYRDAKRFEPPVSRLRTCSP